MKVVSSVNSSVIDFFKRVSKQWTTLCCIKEEKRTIYRM